MRRDERSVMPDGGNDEGIVAGVAWGMRAIWMEKVRVKHRMRRLVALWLGGGALLAATVAPSGALVR